MYFLKNIKMFLKTILESRLWKTRQFLFSNDVLQVHVCYFISFYEWKIYFI